MCILRCKDVRLNSKYKSCFFSSYKYESNKNIMVSEAFIYNTTDLKKFLTEFPVLNHFNFTNDVRGKLRRALFYAATNNGEFLPYFLPLMVGSPESPRSWSELSADINASNESEITKQWIIDVDNTTLSHNNRPCGYRLKKGEPIYKCYTCATGPGSIFCHKCYIEENHQDHDVVISICSSDNGGVCDCGDPEAWHDIFHGEHNQKNIGENLNSILPPRLKLSITEVVSVLLDYMLDIISQSSLILESGKTFTPEELREFSNDSVLRTSVYGEVDQNSTNYYLILYNDEVRHFTDAVQRIQQSSEKVIEFAEMIANVTQSYGRARVLSSQDISYLLSRKKVLELTGLASCIRSYRDFFREEMCDEIMKWIANLLLFSYEGNGGILHEPISISFLSPWKIGSEKVLRSNPVYQKSHIIDGFLNGSYIPTIETSFDNLSPPHWNTTNTNYDMNLSFNINDYLAKVCQYDPNNLPSSRLHYFLYFNIRLWKSIRISFSNLAITCLLSNKDIKLLVTRQFIDIYPQLAQLFVYKDREPEVNCLAAFTPQLFQSPTNASAVVKSGYFKRLFALNFGLFTVKKVISPSKVDVLLPLDTTSLKNRKYTQTLYDLTNLIRQSKCDGILNQDVLYEVCDLLLLFNGICPIKRELIEHVEYESNEYAPVFNAVVLINKLSVEMAHTMEYVRDSNERSKIISQVCSTLNDLVNNKFYQRYSNCDIQSLSLDSQKVVSFLKVNDNDIASYKIVNFRVDSEKLSFLHPVHAFLTWLVHYDNDITSSEMLQRILLGNNLNVNDLYLIFDYPLRTLVLLSQIKIGLWVRNGYSIRSQMHIYHQARLRNLGYKRDIYATQMFLCVVDPATAIATIIDRYGLTAWTRQDYSDFSENSYESNVIIYMVEEALAMLIILLCERNFDTPSDDVRKEIIHKMALNNMPYSALSALLPEGVVANKKFELMFKQVTTYIPPRGITDNGTYKLKDELFDEVDPYYIHYTTNEREECEKILKERLSKKAIINNKNNSNNNKNNNNKPSDMVISPILKNSLENTPFTWLNKFTTTKPFLLFVYSSIRYTLLNDSSKTETLLELTLHLIHISVIENAELNGIRFADVCIELIPGDDNSSLVILMLKLLRLDKFSRAHPKLKVILSDLIKNVNEDVWKSKVGIDEYGPQILGLLKNNSEEKEKEIEDETERKKRIAKLRREKVMSDFKQRQEQFLEKNKVEVEEMDTDVEMDDNGNEEHCILCQMNSKPDDVFGSVCHITESSVFRYVPFDDEYWRFKAFSDSVNLDSDSLDYTEIEGTDKWKEYLARIKSNYVIGPGFPHFVSPSNNINYTNTDSNGNTLVSEDRNSQSNFKTHPVITSCGHGMHFSCYLEYVQSSKSRSSQITRTIPENTKLNEFLCPLCKSLNNVFLPSIWNPNTRNLKDFLAPIESGITWYGALERINGFTSKTINEQKIVWGETKIKLNDRLIDLAEKSLTSINKEAILRPNNAAAIARKTILVDIMKRMERQLSLISPSNNISALIGPRAPTHSTTALITHTIEALEISLRGCSYASPFGGLILDQIPDQTLKYLRTLFEYRTTWLAIVASDKTSQVEAFPTFKNNDELPVFNEQFERLVRLQSNRFFDSVISGDLFQEMLRIPLIQSIDICYNTIVRLFLLGELIQKSYSILVELFNNKNRKGKDGQQPISISDLPRLGNLNNTCLHNVGQLISRLGSVLLTQTDDFHILTQLAEDEEFLGSYYTMIVKAITPFLRRSAVYAYIYCGDGYDSSESLEYEGCEADRLCKFLKIPSISEIIGLCLSSSSYESRRIREFFAYVHVNRRESLQVARIEYPGVHRLIDLPARLDTYFTEEFYKKRRYAPEYFDTAVCMFCGETLRIQQLSVGQKIGECTQHYQHECGNSCGIFFVPSDCSILLLYNGNGSFYPIPYLDGHGELDEQMRNQHPLYLVEDRYKNMIKTLWLQNGVPNFIARKLEGTVDIGGWETL